MKGQSGMTMVELMVSLAIILLVIAAATAAYLKILTSYKTHGALSENFMQNLTGFELLRYDIEMAGYGLPQSMGTITSYTEALQKDDYPSGATYTPPYDPATLNDDPNAPHAFVLSTAGEPTLSGNTSEVLAIKSTAADINSASSHSALVADGAEENGATLVSGDHYIMLNNSGTLVAGTNLWDSTFPPSSYPATSGQVYYMYGLNTSQTTRMPFNRVDYYLDSANLPAYCAQNTYVLYRSVVSQTDGTLEASPLINCVEDFQVAFGIDPSGNGTHALAWQTDLNQENIAGGQGPSVLMTPLQMQQHLREVKVYILYQQGQGPVSTTPNYKFSGTLSLGQDISDLSPLGGKTFTPTGVDAPYRWKVVEIDAKPMNMLNRW